MAARRRATGDAGMRRGDATVMAGSKAARLSHPGIGDPSIFDGRSCAVTDKVVGTAFRGLDESGLRRARGLGRCQRRRR
jgi:hypothetical protein